MKRYNTTFARRRKRVLARDGRCQAVECPEARPDHLTVHHRRPLSQGGTHNLGNMIALCWYHHQLVHGYEARR